MKRKSERRRREKIFKLIHFKWFYLNVVIREELNLVFALDSDYIPILKSFLGVIFVVQGWFIGARRMARDHPRSYLFLPLLPRIHTDNHNSLLGYLLRICNLTLLETVFYRFGIFRSRHRLIEAVHRVSVRESINKR